MAQKKVLVLEKGIDSEIQENDHAYVPNLSVGVQDPSARAHFPAGKNEAGGAPMKFDPGILMALIEMGAMEFDGDDIYVTMNEDTSPPPEVPYPLAINVLTKDNTTEYTPSADYHPATKKYVDENGGGGFTAETLALPITGWAVDGTYTDFVSVVVNITKIFSITDIALLDPILLSLTATEAWNAMGLIRAERNSDSSIILYAITENTTAINFELKIYKS